MGLGSFLSGLPIVGDVLGGLTGTAQAEAQVSSAGLQATVSKASVRSQERIFDKQLEFDKEKFEYLKEQAEKPTGPLAQGGSYGYPYVSVQQIKEPSLILPLAIGAGFFYFLVIKRKR